MPIFSTPVHIRLIVTAGAICFNATATPILAQARDTQTVVPVCTTLPPTSDSTHVLVVAKVTASGKTPPLPPWFASLIAEELRNRLTPPSRLDLNVMTQRDSTYTQAVPYVGAHAYFTLRKGAFPKDISFGTGTMHGELRQALLSAIFRLHGDSLPAFPNGAKRLEIELEVYTVPDTGKHSNAWFRATLPVYPVDAPPRFLKEQSKRPKYPYNALQAGKGDSVEIEFVLGPDGRAVTSTMDPIKGTYRSFAKETLRILPQMRFEPLRICGCAVEAYVKMSFFFMIQ